MFQDGIDRRRLLFGMAACSLCGLPLGTGAAEAKIAPASPVDPVEIERHNILMLLTAKLVHEAWTIPLGVPSLVAAYRSIEPTRSFRNYAGHNIGALAVGAQGEPVAFAMNRNVALNSPLEHAEARVLRKVVALDNAAADKRIPFPAIFRGYRIFTTLESCSMCSGMMDLCRISDVYYAQEDPSQKHIGDVLYRLHEADGPAGRAPRPALTSYCALTPELAAAHKSWLKRTGESRPGTQIIAFLFSPEAYEAFRKVAGTFETFRPSHKENEAYLATMREASKSLAETLD